MSSHIRAFLGSAILSLFLLSTQSSYSLPRRLFSRGTAQVFALPRFPGLTVTFLAQVQTSGASSEVKSSEREGVISSCVPVSGDCVRSLSNLFSLLTSPPSRWMETRLGRGYSSASMVARLCTESLHVSSLHFYEGDLILVLR